MSKSKAKGTAWGQDPRNYGDLWENRGGPRGAGNTAEGLTHSLDLGKEELGMKPTRKYTYRLAIPLSAVSTPEFRERFAAKVVEAPGGCHRWTGAKSTNGYGHIWVNQIKTTVKAHRVAYMLEVGAGIDSRLDLDHLCRNRWCVNPAHLEPVTRAENLARGEGPNAESLRSQIDNGTCAKGHDLHAPNAWRKIRGGQSRACRVCSNDWARANGGAA